MIKPEYRVSKYYEPRPSGDHPTYTYYDRYRSFEERGEAESIVYASELVVRYGLRRESIKQVYEIWAAYSDKYCCGWMEPDADSIEKAFKVKLKALNPRPFYQYIEKVKCFGLPGVYCFYRSPTEFTALGTKIISFLLIFHLPKAVFNDTINILPKYKKLWREPVRETRYWFRTFKKFLFR